MLDNIQALALIKEYNEGSRRALNDLIILHQPLVGYYARKYFTSLSKHPIIELDDIISAANVGLLKAIKSFNNEKGTMFKYFAGRAIKQAIMDFILVNINTIRSPQNKLKSDHQIYKEIERLEGELKREISEQDIEESELFSKDAIHHFYNKISTSPIGTFDVADEEEEDEQGEQLERIKDCFPHLTEQEKYVITHFFSLDDVEEKTLTMMGDELGVTKQYISHVKQRALNKIKKLIDNRR